MSREKELNVTGLLGYTLKKTQHMLRLCMDEALKDFDLTTPQYAVLAQLELKPGISNAVLSRAAFITAQTMHGIVANLEKRGLIKRRNDPKNGRILCTELTEQGSAVVTHAHAVIRNVESRMLACISKDNKILLEKLLVECFNNLNNSGAD